MDANQELFAIFRAEVDEQIEDLCDLLERKPDRWRIDRLFQIAHNVKGAARIVGVDTIRGTAHALEDLFAAVRDGRQLEDLGINLARSGAQLLADCFAAIDEGDPPDISEFRRDVDEWRGSAADAPLVLDKGAPDEELPGQEPSRSADTDGEQPNKDQHNKPRQESTIRVGTEKVEALMGLASEFVSLVFRSEGQRNLARQVAMKIATIQNKWPDLKTDPEVREALRLSRALVRELVDHSNDSLRVSDELQGSVRALRMVRIDGLRVLLKKSIREACAEVERSAELYIVGGRTEVDRGVLEQLRDPLIHLVRNAVVHGTEGREDRERLGKPETGRLELIARSAGAWVEIIMRDDGRGIDVDKVRECAIASNIVTRDEIAETGDDEILELLFQPGITTATEITELAGRGVGLDVVRTQMSRLGGRATIRSRLGSGTEVTLRVPLTRLTTNGIIVRVGEQLFAVPTNEVERTVQVSDKDVSIADGAEVIQIEDRLVRIASLAKMVGVAGGEAVRKHAVVVTDGPRRRALLVDEVLGQREYILQPLAWNLEGSTLVSGTTVIDGGTVLPVLDSYAMVGSSDRTDGWLSGQEVRRYRLLVVDDSATSRTLERNILKTAGYEVLTAVDGESALQLLKDEEIDLVVSDIEMPNINGFELTRRIRAKSALERLPVILVTSLGSEEDKREGAEAGADAYIVKGAFDQDELLTTVARLL